MTEERQPDAQFAPNFRVGDWLVEPSLDRVSRNGTAVRLRPQLTNLLVLLARRAGRTVSKDEMLAAVWDHRFIAESGFSRCVAELRQALQDDARAPTLLQTIPKRGYRLVAPVVFLDGPPADDGCAERGEPSPRAPVGVASTAAPPRGAGHPRAFLWTMASSAGAGVLIALAWGGLGWSRAPAAMERQTVLVADVRNTTGEVSFDHALPLAMTVELGRAPFLRILSPAQAGVAPRGAGRTQAEAAPDGAGLAACRRSGAAILLSGSIVRLDTHYAFGLEATACGTGESIFGELTEVESKDRVLKAVESSAARLRRHLAIRLRLGSRPAAG